VQDRQKRSFETIVIRDDLRDLEGNVTIRARIIG
jgi:hypothetical protein